MALLLIRVVLPSAEETLAELIVRPTYGAKSAAAVGRIAARGS